MGYLAAVTSRIKLTTGVLVLPQRQTALAAKQAAEVDILSGGRLILGLGVGNSELEYEALGENLHDRGRRLDEQIEVLRLLWTQPSVVFHGKYHDLSDVAINPRPVQQPIPIWVGGSADAVLARAGRIASGWVPTSGSDLRPMIEKIARSAEAAGRSIDDVLIAPRIMKPLEGGPEEWLASAEAWREQGAGCVFLNTRDQGLKTVQEHLDLGERFRDAMGPVADPA